MARPTHSHSSICDLVLETLGMDTNYVSHGFVFVSVFTLILLGVAAECGARYRS